MEETKQKIIPTDFTGDVQEIIKLMDSSSKEDAELVTRAYNFAKEAHKNQKRFSGEPYFLHLHETAKNLAKLGMDATSISAGLLHDVIEDAHATPLEVEKTFGAEILFLIEGVTKLGKLKYRGAERHIESLRKLFVATAQDLRVLIIKLTDRLHNMQTLQYVRKEKQKRIALETLEIYAPLAYRLGIRTLNRKLEDLAFEYVYPEEYKKVKKIIKDTVKDAEERLTKFVNNIKKELAKVGERNFRTDYRVKGLYSLYKKLERKKDIANIHDILAIRIILPNEADCYRVLGILHGAWRPLPGRIKDFIAFPKPNGYRSLHTTVFTGDGSVVELQIRTEDMHREAQYGVAAHISYKEGFMQKTLNPNLLWIWHLLPSPRKFFGNKTTATDNALAKKFSDIPQWIKLMAEAQEKTSKPEEYMEGLKGDFFEHRIFVFTPKGDVMDLPTKSSPIDFAYAVHSDIGDHISGVKVNGKMVSLDTSLHNGDIVEIITKESSRPTQKWLDLAKTTLAKRHIRNNLNLRNKN
ncbi:MAG: RelA/SpoT family protein [bacterium]|nr:RelA/SpoT family protein [bacterium]